MPVITKTVGEDDKVVGYRYKKREKVTKEMGLKKGKIYLRM